MVEKLSLHFTRALSPWHAGAETAAVVCGLWPVVCGLCVRACVRAQPSFHSPEGEWISLTRNDIAFGSDNSCFLPADIWLGWLGFARPTLSDFDFTFGTIWNFDCGT